MRSSQEKTKRLGRKLWKNGLFASAFLFRSLASICDRRRLVSLKPFVLDIAASNQIEETSQKYLNNSASHFPRFPL